MPKRDTRDRRGRVQVLSPEQKIRAKLVAAIRYRAQKVEDPLLHSRKYYRRDISQPIGWLLAQVRGASHRLGTGPRDLRGLYAALRFCRRDMSCAESMRAAIFHSGIEAHEAWLDSLDAEIFE